MTVNRDNSMAEWVLYSDGTKKIKITGSKILEQLVHLLGLVYTA